MSAEVFAASAGRVCALLWLALSSAVPGRSLCSSLLSLSVDAALIVQARGSQTETLMLRVRPRHRWMGSAAPPVLRCSRAMQPRPQQRSALSMQLGKAGRVS